jgi:hypothetical protein
MRRVLKYPINLPEGTRIFVPFHAPLRLVSIQMGTPTVWYEVEEGAPLVQRTIGFVGTGHEIPWGPADADHIGSAFDPQTGLVWHLYELKAPSSG